MRWPSRSGVQRNPDPAASMALLEEVLDPPVGPGYHSAAEARQRAGLAPSSGCAEQPATTADAAATQMDPLKNVTAPSVVASRDRA